jgi:TPR repeat protein
LYTLAAEQGDATAQNKLAMMYEYGRGVAQDDAAAQRWHGRALAQGSHKQLDETDGINRAAIAEQSGTVYHLSDLSLSKR